MKCLHHGRKSVVLGDAVNVGKLAMKKIQARFQFAGERRQVTALFYDIVGSTELLLRTEPEQFFRSVSALHQSADTIIAKHGGFVHQRLGDGGCCYFGFPNQSEDAAESAVRASLELVGSLTKPKSRTGRPLKLRIGIATSFVVFSAEGDEIVGAAPILAARLQGEADPNSVLVADSTVRLTQGLSTIPSSGRPISRVSTNRSRSGVPRTGIRRRPTNSLSPASGRCAAGPASLPLFPMRGVRPLMEGAARSR